MEILILPTKNWINLIGVFLYAVGRTEVVKLSLHRGPRANRRDFMH